MIRECPILHTDLVRQTIRVAAFVLAAVLGLGTSGVVTSAPPTVTLAPFAERVKTLSEPGGSFDTDNLISNEGSYLEVVPRLLELGLTGGAYIGVGPDQNFSYIARLRPSVAYIIDVRHDNLLLHLLFKALFAEAPTRVAFISALLGRELPAADPRWRAAPLAEILDTVDKAALVPRDALRRRTEARLVTFGVPLTMGHLETIARFHDAFIEGGTHLRFQSHGRAPQWYYPTLRQLWLATDRKERQWSYLADEDAFATIRDLHAKDAIIPVVGDVSGSHALAAIGEALAASNLRVSAFYVSNVENYLFRRGRFEPYAENLRRLPHGPTSVIIRSIFRGGPSRSTVAPLEALLEAAKEGRIQSYMDVLTARRP